MQSPSPEIRTALVSRAVIGGAMPTRWSLDLIGRLLISLHAAWLAVAVAVLVAGCGGRTTMRGASASEEAAIVDLAAPTIPVPPERFLKPDEALIAPGDHLALRIWSYN